MTPTFYRHRNDDWQPELVVRCWDAGKGDLWGLTVTDGGGAFDPDVIVHVRTSQFDVYAAFSEFFQALAERKPTSLDETAALLSELGVVDDTAGVERRRAQAAAAWPDDDSWPYP